MRTVTVIGQGTSREVPDTVVVRVAAAHRAAGVAEALAGADSAATEIVAVGRRHTDASQISSTNLNVWPAYDNQGKPSGFEARHSLQLSCSDVTKAGALLSELATTVGDRLQVEGLGMEVADPGRAMVRARAAAYADAVAKAGQLAELAGGRLGDVQAMAEGSGMPWPVMDMAAGGAQQMAKSVSIQPGETALTATLTITFMVV
jgi:uncharacterized protein YggE